MKKYQKNNDNDEIEEYNSIFKYLLLLLLLLLSLLLFLSEALTNISRIYFKTMNIFGQ